MEDKRRQLDQLRSQMGNIKNLVGQMDNDQIMSDPINTQNEVGIDANVFW